MFRFTAALIALSLVGAPLGAQQIATIAYAPPVESAAQRAAVPPVASAQAQKPNTPSMLFAGFIGGAVGLFGGGVVGYGLKSCTPDEWFCGMGEAVVGAMIGEMIMLPYGVHLSSQHSTYGEKLLWSLAALGLGVVAAPATDGASLLAVPPLQLILTLTAEHAAARRKAQSNGENGR
jgi:hypothetical protein